MVRHWRPCQRRVQLSARSDAELGKCAVEVRADRAVREEQPLADLAVRESAGRKLGDLELLRRQLITRFRQAAPAALPRRTQLASRLLAPRCAPERVEGLTRGPQDAPGL